MGRGTIDPTIFAIPSKKVWNSNLRAKNYTVEARIEYFLRNFFLCLFLGNRIEHENQLYSIVLQFAKTAKKYLTPLARRKWVPRLTLYLIRYWEQIQHNYYIKNKKFILYFLYSRLIPARNRYYHWVSSFRKTLPSMYQWRIHSSKKYLKSSIKAKKIDSYHNLHCFRIKLITPRKKSSPKYVLPIYYIVSTKNLPKFLVKKPLINSSKQILLSNSRLFTTSIALKSVTNKQQLIQQLLPQLKKRITLPVIRKIRIPRFLLSYRLLSKFFFLVPAYRYLCYLKSKPYFSVFHSFFQKKKIKFFFAGVLKQKKEFLRRSNLYKNTFTGQEQWQKNLKKNSRSAYIKKNIKTKKIKFPPRTSRIAHLVTLNIATDTTYKVPIFKFWMRYIHTGVYRSFFFQEKRNNYIHTKILNTYNQFLTYIRLRFNTRLRKNRTVALIFLFKHFKLFFKYLKRAKLKRAKWLRRLKTFFAIRIAYRKIIAPFRGHIGGVNMSALIWSYRAVESYKNIKNNITTLWYHNCIIHFQQNSIHVTLLYSLQALFLGIARRLATLNPRFNSFVFRSSLQGKWLQLGFTKLNAAKYQQKHYKHFSNQILALIQVFQLHTSRQAIDSAMNLVFLWYLQLFLKQQSWELEQKLYNFTKLPVKIFFQNRYHAQSLSPFAFLTELKKNYLISWKSITQYPNYAEIVNLLTTILLYRDSATLGQLMGQQLVLTKAIKNFKFFYTLGELIPACLLLFRNYALFNSHMIDLHLFSRNQNDLTRSFNWYTNTTKNIRFKVKGMFNRRVRTGKFVLHIKEKYPVPSLATKNIKRWNYNLFHTHGVRGSFGIRTNIYYI